MSWAKTGTWASPWPHFFFLVKKSSHRPTPPHPCLEFWRNGCEVWL